MSELPSSEVREVLSKRHRYLSYLLDEPRRKSAIETRLGVSRSTVDYAIRELLDYGLADRVGDGFHATAFGQLAFATFRRFDRTIEAQCEALDALSELPPDSLREPRVFEDAEVVLPEPTGPDRPLRRFLDLIKGADRVRGVTPVVQERTIDVLGELVTNGAAVDFVTTAEVLERFSSTYATRLIGILGADNFTLYETTEEPPYGLVIVTEGSERHLAILIYDDTGICGTIMNESPSAIEWGEEVRDRYQTLAQPVITRGGPVATR